MRLPLNSSQPRHLNFHSVSYKVGGPCFSSNSSEIALEFVVKAYQWQNGEQTASPAEVYSMARKSSPAELGNGFFLMKPREWGAGEQSLAI